ncbi:hypothetical protein ACTJKN_02650 [Pedobacter sp. 22163]|uniref:hypothetical protein n=1 Tax=Pedobacter sp. 22163 TaxID=3453883 RepID=UPI003F832C0F
MGNAIDDLQNLFNEAKAKNEFEFVMTLLNYKSIGSPQVQANLHEWFEAMQMYIELYNQYSGKEKTRMAALLYSTFFENSDFYNIIGNLCRGILGMRATSYLFWKTKKHERLLGIGEKQDFLIELLTDTAKNFIVEFFQNIHYPSIRNSFFHSSYSLQDDRYILHDAEINISGVIYKSFDTGKFFYPLVDEVIIFFIAFQKNYLDHFNSYQEDKPINNTPLGKNGVIIGTPNGLGGMRFFKTVSFFGEWHDSGLWTDERFGIFGGHNLTFNFASIEQIEIDERLNYYENKGNIRVTDAAFFNLIDKVVERNLEDELYRTSKLLIKAGEIKEAMMIEEKNPHKKKSFPKMILPFYNRALELLDGLGDTQTLARKIKELEEIHNS